MDYENKYKEALKAAISAHKDEDRHLKATLERIFPELKESEDVQHRKFILEYLYDGLRKSDEQFKGQFKCAINWLEKQGDANKEYWRGYREGKQEILDKYAELEKQGEQKPTIEMRSAEESLGIDSETYNKIVDECIYGEQKSWSEENEHRIKLLEALCEDKLFESVPNSTMYEEMKITIDWLNSLRPQSKQEWSEEDRDYYDAIIAKLEVTQDDAALTDNQMVFLKSLKGRVQPKQEWNKEDEKMIGRLRDIVEKYAFSQSAVDVNGDLCEKEYIEADNWLKSLRQRIGG